MTSDAITIVTVRAALAAARHAHSKGRLAAQPLGELASVRARMVEYGLRDDHEHRFRALAALLGDLIWWHLAYHRGAAVAGTHALPPGEPGAVVGGGSGAIDRQRILDDLAADFRAGSQARERWGALYARYTAPAQLPVSALAEAAGVGRVTLARRLNEGLAMLVDALWEVEHKAQANQAAQRAAATPSAPDVDSATDVLPRRDALPPDRRRPAPMTLESPAVRPSLAERENASLASYRVARIAEWSAPRFALDQGFVQLTLLVDRGSGAGERWDVREHRYGDLASAAAAAGSPAIVLLGPPGAGKSTLLRHFELEMSSAGLRGETRQITFLAPLSQYRRETGERPPPPEVWLAARWQKRYPHLPPFERLLARGQVALLLDGLNEMPHRGHVHYHELVASWRRFLGDAVRAGSGNQAVISCRSLDYSAPLSSPELPVPHVRIEPLTDEQVRALLGRYSGEAAGRVWERLVASPMLEVMRVPLTLRLVAEQAALSGHLPAGRAALYTQVVRHALRREIEQGAPIVAPGDLLTVDDLRQVTLDEWRRPYDLPERGRLFALISNLAVAMQQRAGAPGGAEVRFSRDQLHDLLGDLREPVLQVGTAIDLLDEDVAGDEVFFRHQLWQEYFAARQLARMPDAECVRQPWRASETKPSTSSMLAELPPGEPLPALPASGWEEATLLAVSLHPSPGDYIAGLMDVNLPLAGRAAAQADVRGRLSEPMVNRLREALATRCRDPEADLRARIAAALALGPLGDPRFERRFGPAGEACLPPLVAVPGGRFRIGRNAPFEVMGRRWSARYVEQALSLGPFALAQFPLTNAEWECFMAAGGYDDPRWWPTSAAAAWRRGEGTARGIHDSVRTWTHRYRAEPDLLEETYRSGSYGEAFYQRWLRRIAMTDDELEAHLRETYPSVRRTEPAHWSDSRFNQPLQPVVGITWFEARAYCLWLAALTGLPFRLPRDIELEAAARGLEGREYPYGDEFRALGGNTVSAHIRQTSPIGVFVEGDTPEGLADMSGNVEAWTSTLVSMPSKNLASPMVYDSALDDPAAPDDARRVLRGGSWRDNFSRAHPAYGVGEPPDSCPDTAGLRLACDC